ncbi:MAG: triose-phosphate isomerase family protein [Clostridia bacterium]
MLYKKKKHIFVNLKRFELPRKEGGLNGLCGIDKWGYYIVNGIKDGIKKYTDSEFAVFFPEAFTISAKAELTESDVLQIGCQGVHYNDVAINKNFGAFTTSRSAKSMKLLGCDYAMIGHCEERADKLNIMTEAGVADKDAVSRILNKEVKCAVESGLKVLFCIGETVDEQPEKYDIIKRQIEIGLNDVDRSNIVIAYEPVWAIGPGKTPPDKEYIQNIARHIKEVSGDLHVVYGGGLKLDNAKMLSSIEEIDGGLIGLTQFTGEIGFYPDQYLEIIKEYFGR